MGDDQAVETGAPAPTDAADTARAIVLEGGIPGLTEDEDFVIEVLGDDQSAFQLLRSTGDGELALIVTVPWLFFPDYAPDLPDAECAALGIERAEDAVVFNSVTLDSEQSAIHVNLMGPFVVNRATHRGRQLVLADSTWPVRATVALDLT